MINIELKNLDKVSGNFQKRSKNTKKAIENIIVKSIFQLEREIKIESPVRTGRLRASTGGGGFEGGSFPAGEGIKFQLNKNFASIGPTVKYAKFVNARNQFMERGVNKSLSKIKQIAKEEIRKAIDV